MQPEYKLKLDSFIEEIMETYGGQGIGVIGFDKEEVLYFKTFGYKDVEKKLEIDMDTIFGIASISKSFTNIGLLKLVEAGKLDLENKIDVYFPEIRLPADQMPTLKNLMSHTAGFFPQERFLMNDVAKALEIGEESEKSESHELFEKGLEMIIERINKMDAYTGKPGDHHSYSNFSYGLITALIQRYSDERDYVQYMMNHVIKPMGLDRTFYSFNKTKSVDNITKLYEWVLDHMNTLDDYTDQGFVLLGGGAVKSTLRDLMAYTRMYLNDGNLNVGPLSGTSLLSQELLGDMTSPYAKYKPYEYYGLGLVGGSFDGIDFAGHSGGLTGVSSYFGFTKETGKGVVVVCNTSNVPVTPIGVAALKYLNGTDPDWQLAHYLPSSWTGDQIDKIIGVYKTDEGANIEIKRNNTGGILYLSGGLEQKVELLENNALKVFNKTIWSYAPVIFNEDGSVKAIYSGSRMIRKIS